eukprot:SAG22_NODE_1618_length_3971_cov_2.707645_4_plen_90_part_00
MAVMAARSPDDRTEISRVYEELYGGGPEGTYSSVKGGMKLSKLRDDITESLDAPPRASSGAVRPSVRPTVLVLPVRMLVLVLVLRLYGP